MTIRCEPVDLLANLADRIVSASAKSDRIGRELDGLYRCRDKGMPVPGIGELAEEWEQWVRCQADLEKQTLKAEPTTVAGALVQLWVAAFKLREHGAEPSVVATVTEAVNAAVERLDAELGPFEEPACYERFRELYAVHKTELESAHA